MLPKASVTQIPSSGHSIVFSVSPHVLLVDSPSCVEHAFTLALFSTHKILNTSAFPGLYNKDLKNSCSSFPLWLCYQCVQNDFSPVSVEVVARVWQVWLTPQWTSCESLVCDSVSKASQGPGRCFLAAGGLPPVAGVAGVLPSGIF